MKRQCPFDGCKRSVCPTKFACWSHWRTLSGKQKQEIYAAYYDYLEDRIGLVELRRRQQVVLDAAQGKG